jgi:D-hydroxyproline dehydrogenase subunit gamma
MIKLFINGNAIEVPAGTSVAAAVIRAGYPSFRKDRGPLCGIGVCFECRVTLNGRAHERSCQLICEPGMEVSTEDASRA